MTVTLRQLEYLVIAAREGSISAAAEHLGMSQSTISGSLGELERSLGVTLFLRHARGLTLTRDGERVVTEAKRLLQDAESLERNASLLRTEISGTLHVCCYSTIAATLLPAVVTDLLEHHPALTVTFSEGSQAEVLDEISQGRCDVAVLYDYPFRTPLEGMAARKIPLTSIAPYALLPPHHRLKDRSTVGLAELALDPFILFDLEPSAEYFLSLFHAEGIVPHTLLHTSSAETVRGFVARGAGFSILNQPVAIPVSRDGLPYLARRLSGHHPGLEVVAVVPGSQPPSKRAQTFIDSAKKSFTRQGKSSPT